MTLSENKSPINCQGPAGRAPIEEIAGGTRLAQARSDIYRLLSHAFLKPDADSPAIISEATCIESLKSSFSLLKSAASSDKSPVSGALAKAAEKCSITIAAMEKEYSCGCGYQPLADNYTRTFGNPIEMPMNETFYSTSQVFAQTQELSDIAGFYRAFGLAIAEDAHERVDHIAVELEFMHFLSMKEAHAQEHHGPGQVDICRTGQRKFLGEHLGRWAGAFSRLVEKRMGPSFYGSAGKLMESFISFELMLFAIEPDLLGGPVESLRTESPEGRSFSCGSGDLMRGFEESVLASFNRGGARGI